MIQSRFHVKYWPDGALEATRSDKEKQLFQLISRNSQGILHSITVHNNRFYESQLQVNMPTGKTGAYFVHFFRGENNAVAGRWSSISADGTQTGWSMATPGKTNTVKTINPVTGGQQTTTTVTMGNTSIIHQEEVDPQSGQVTMRDRTITITTSSDHTSSVETTTTISHSDDGNGNTSDSTVISSVSTDNDGNVTTNVSTAKTFTDASGGQVSVRANSVTNPDGSSSITVSDIAGDGTVTISTTTTDGAGNGTVHITETDPNGDVTSDTTTDKTANSPGSGGGGQGGRDTPDQGDDDHGDDNHGDDDHSGEEHPEEPETGGSGGDNKGMDADDDTGGGGTSRVKFHWGESQNGDDENAGEAGFRSMRQILSGLKNDIHQASDNDGWGDAGSEGPSGSPVMQGRNIIITVHDGDDWEDSKNPRALVAVVGELMFSGVRATIGQMSITAGKLKANF